MGGGPKTSDAEIEGLPRRQSLWHARPTWFSEEEHVLGKSVQQEFLRSLGSWPSRFDGW